MNQKTKIFLKFTRRFYNIFYNKIKRLIINNSNSTVSQQKGRTLHYVGQDASDLIKNKLLDKQPCMISRIGSTELKTIITWLEINRKPKFPLDKSINYILGNPPFWWDENIKHDMRCSSGFFPVTDSSLEAFSKRMIQDIQNIDILGSWRKNEMKLSYLLENVSTVRLKDFEPYSHSDPWSYALQNQVVLVIHPFEQSIKKQYNKRQLLFEDERVLPEFELKTLKAVQSIAGNNPGFKTWFEALDWMCQQIASIEFDVAIIGAGAYGLPLASYIKSIGKKAVHLGGGTQILFGIKGERWDKNPRFQKLYNQSWVRPLPSETPNNSESVDRGYFSYW